MVRCKQAAKKSDPSLNLNSAKLLHRGVFPNYISPRPPHAKFPRLQKRRRGGGDTPILRGPDALNVNPP